MRDAQLCNLHCQPAAAAGTQHKQCLQQCTVVPVALLMVPCLASRLVGWESTKTATYSTPLQHCVEPSQALIACL